jgi:hypothetical protein
MRCAFNFLKNASKTGAQRRYLVFSPCILISQPIVQNSSFGLANTIFNIGRCGSL